MPRELTAPVAGTVSAIAQPGERVPAGGVVAVVEAMKMEHEVVAEAGGEVVRVDVAVGDTVTAGQPLAQLKGSGPLSSPRDVAPTARPALDEVLARHAAGLDAARPEAVARRREQGRRTARENVADLVDDGHVRRVRAADLRRAGGAAAEGGADRADAGRRARRRHRRDRRVARRGHVLRLHGPGRHAGHAEPPEEGPAVRARRAAAAAGGAVGRGRGRAARRRRLADRGRARLPRVPPVRAAVRAGAAGGHRRRATASPATRRCSAAATSSSRPRTRVSAWAGRR